MNTPAKNTRGAASALTGGRLHDSGVHAAGGKGMGNGRRVDLRSGVSLWPRSIHLATNSAGKRRRSHLGDRAMPARGGWWIAKRRCDVTLERAAGVERAASRLFTLTKKDHWHDAGKAEGRSHQAANPTHAEERDTAAVAAARWRSRELGKVR